MRLDHFFVQDPDFAYVDGIHFVASQSALHLLCFESNRSIFDKKKLQYNEASNPIIDQTIKQLKEYFSGARLRFDLPYVFEGSDFQMSVWRQLEKIPYGHTISYTEQARMMGREMAVRAVATANARNPLPLIVPCHRVIRGDSSLGGYAGGKDLKKSLLAHENAVLKGPACAVSMSGL